MEQLYEQMLHDVFARAVAQDAALVEKVRSFDGTLYFNGGDLVFTLPDLFRFLLAKVPPSERPRKALRYTAFRSMVYRLPTNTLLADIGAVVVVETAAQQHALTLYRLKARRT